MECVFCGMNPMNPNSVNLDHPNSDMIDYKG